MSPEPPPKEERPGTPAESFLPYKEVKPGAVAAASSVESSGKFGSPWNKGCAKSVEDRLVEGARPLLPPIPDTPRGRKKLAVARFCSMVALGADACIELPPEVIKDPATPFT